MNDTTNDTPSETVEQPAAGPAPQPRRLVRYPERGPGAGVAEGLGMYFGLDPVIFRIAFVLLAFAGGSGILAYLVAWVVMPTAGPGDPVTPAARADNEQLMTWAGIGLIVVAAAMLFSGPFDMFGPGGLWALLLIGGGLLLFHTDKNRQETPPAEAGPPPSGAAVPTSPARPPAPQPAPPPAPSSPLGRMTAGLALVAAGLAALLDYAGAVDVGATEYLALLLVVVGGGLLVSTWWGQARGLIGAGIVLLALLAVSVATSSAVHVAGGVGERAWTPATAAEVEPAYELFAGEGVLDLRDVALTEDTHVRAGITFGSLTVLVPEDTAVVVTAQATGGEIDLLGEQMSGLGVDHRIAVDGARGSPELYLDLRVVFGEIIVRHR